MASFLIDEEKFIEDNIFMYEERASSPLSRFIDKSPTFVTYYHINNNESTVDGGFQDIEDVIGERSPIRFQKIESFPVYGLDPVLLSLSEEEQGLDTSYESELVILPNTIKPLPNDFFTINHVNDSFVFRVKEVNYDTIRPDNFYKITFRFEYLDDEIIHNLNNQVHGKYSCILSNIGTEEKCIIREDYKDKLIELNTMYNNIVSMYLAMFYSDRHNCLIGRHISGNRIFDPLQSIFCNKHGLFNQKNDYNTFMLSTQVNDPMRDLKYEKSVYRLIENPSLTRLTRFPYIMSIISSNQISTFYRWYERDVMMMDIMIPTCSGLGDNVFGSEFVDDIKTGNDNMVNSINILIKKYIRNEISDIFEIPKELYEDLLYIENNHELFLFTPIILYIIRNVTRAFLMK